MNKSSATSIVEAAKNPPKKKTGNRFLWFVAALWLGGIISALSWMADYSFKPGAVQATPGSWPMASRIQRNASQPTLLLFLHPRCPCSRATIGELALLAAHCQGHFTAQVWFARPAGVTDQWMQTDLWKSAAQIPGVTVHTDEGGTEAQLFHALTSGHAMLYENSGRLIFQGGITFARGHSGDNEGRSALEEFIEGRGARAPGSTPVFGCALAAAAPLGKN